MKICSENKVIHQEHGGTTQRQCQPSDGDTNALDPQNKVTEYNDCHATFQTYQQLKLYSVENSDCFYNNNVRSDDLNINLSKKKQNTIIGLL